MWLRLKMYPYSLRCLQSISKLDKFWSLLHIGLVLVYLHKSLHDTCHLHKLWNSFLLSWFFACSCSLLTACCTTSRRPVESVWCMVWAWYLKMCTINVEKHLLVILSRKYANLSRKHFVLIADILVVKLFICLKRAEILYSDISCAYLLNGSIS